MLIETKSLKSVFKAFSLVEVLVTMTISVIVIGFALTIFLQFSELYRLKKKQWENDTELLSFIKCFSDDLDSAIVVSYVEPKLYLEFRDGTKCQYLINEKTISRICETETFEFPISVGNLEVFKHSDKNQLVTGIQFSFDESNADKELFVQKKYNSSELINEIEVFW